MKSSRLTFSGGRYIMVKKIVHNLIYIKIFIPKNKKSLQWLIRPALKGPLLLLFYLMILH